MSRPSSATGASVAPNMAASSIANGGPTATASPGRRPRRPSCWSSCRCCGPRAPSRWPATSGCSTTRPSRRSRRYLWSPPAVSLGKFQELAPDGAGRPRRRRHRRGAPPQRRPARAARRGLRVVVRRGRAGRSAAVRHARRLPARARRHGGGAGRGRRGARRRPATSPTRARRCASPRPCGTICWWPAPSRSPWPRCAAATACSCTAACSSGARPRPSSAAVETATGEPWRGDGLAAARRDARRRGVVEPLRGRLESAFAWSAPADGARVASQWSVPVGPRSESEGARRRR